jgi:hypothetical protein
MCTLGDVTDVKFWQIPRHRLLTYSLSTPCFVTTAPLAVKPASTPRRLVQKKKAWRDSLSIDMLLSAVSVLVVAQSSSEIPEGLMNNPEYYDRKFLSNELLIFRRAVYQLLTVIPKMPTLLLQTSSNTGWQTLT